LYLKELNDNIQKIEDDIRKLLNIGHNVTELEMMLNKLKDERDEIYYEMRKNEIKKMLENLNLYIDCCITFDELVYLDQKISQIERKIVKKI